VKQDDGIFSTPFELVHCTKPDLYTLFKPFCLAAVRRERLGNDVLPNFFSQSIPMITLGKCPNSDGLQFFNPENGTIISSIDYKFQSHVTSGARFGYKYQAGTFIFRLDETTTAYEPTFPIDSKVLVHTHSPPHLATIIGTPSYIKPNVYTVKFHDNSISEYSILDDLLEAAPTSSQKPNTPLLPERVKGGSTTTLFLTTMSKP